MRCGNAVCIYASVTRDVADLVHVFIEKQGKQKKVCRIAYFFLLFLFWVLDILGKIVID